MYSCLSLIKNRKNKKKKKNDVNRIYNQETNKAHQFSID